MSASRQYDLVVFGATGYTGKLTAEHIATSLPTDLRWALAGRSQSKLEAVAAECKALNSDRIQPAIEIVNLNDAELSALAKKTTVLLATVGPYALHGEHAFKACAENGTHYIDVTGEIPWVAAMIKKYEKAAKASGSILIPQTGIESAPADLITWSLVNAIQEKFSAPTAEVIVSVHELSGAPSGGTLLSVFTLLDVFSLKEMSAVSKPYSLSPVPGPKTRDSASWITKILGIRSVPDLGILTTSIAGVCDVPIVQRSWGLLGYGPNFSITEYMKTRNYLTGVAFHFALLFGSLLLAIPLFRKGMKKVVTQPGNGPTKEQAAKERVEYRGIGKPDIDAPNAPRAFVRAYYDGSIYALTGILAAESAISILRDNHKLPGGIYTPASLGQKFIDRLQSKGFKFEKKFYD